MINDMEYSLGGMPFNLQSGMAAVLFLAIAKLGLEWVPTVAILCIFRPCHDCIAPEPIGGVDPLLPLDARVRRGADLAQ